jgi:hypothetical protein
MVDDNWLEGTTNANNKGKQGPRMYLHCYRGWWAVMAGDTKRLTAIELDGSLKVFYNFPPMPMIDMPCTAPRNSMMTLHTNRGAVLLA